MYKEYALFVAKHDRLTTSFLFLFNRYCGNGHKHELSNDKLTRLVFSVYRQVTTSNYSPCRSMNCQILSTVHIPHPLPRPLRVRIQIPPAVSSKFFTCPYLSTSVLNCLPLKKLFIPFHPIVTWLGLRGPSTLLAPYRLLLYYLFPIIFLFLPSLNQKTEEATPSTDL